MSSLKAICFTGAVLLLVVLELGFGGPILRAEGVAIDDPDYGSMSWPNHGGGIDNRRDAAFEKKISKESVASLSLAWTFETGYDVSATPAIDAQKGIVYFPSWNGMLFAVKQKSGEVVWKKNLTELTAPFPEVAALTYYLPYIKSNFNLTIGETAETIPLANLVSRSTPTIAGSLLLVGLYNPCILLALDRSTGCIVWLSKSLDTHPYCVITMSVTFYDGSIYLGTSSAEESAPSDTCCTFQGAFFKLDGESGEVLWRVPMLPDNHNKTGLYAGAAIWGSSPPIDVKRRLVYIATGNTYSTPPDEEACELARQNETNPTFPDPCLSPENHQESILAINIDTGKIAWATQLGGYDTWTLTCLLSPVKSPNCPSVLGPDYDFGEAPFLLSIKAPNSSETIDVVTAGQKSGVVHTLDRQTGKIVWQTVAGPGGEAGGASWGMATDGERVFTNIINDEGKNFTLVPSSIVVTSGGWVGMNASTGEIIWSTPNPFGQFQAISPVTHANGVVFGASLGNPTSGEPLGSIVALDAVTGDLLWTYDTAAGLGGGVSVSDGCIYQPVGGSLTAFGLPSLPALHGKTTISLCVP